MILPHISQNIFYVFAVNQLFHLYEKLYNKNSLQTVIGLQGQEALKVTNSHLVVLLDMLMCWMVLRLCYLNGHQEQ